MLSVGDEIGRYRIGAVLGSGRLTRVYNATHMQLGSRHAIKFFLDPHPELQRLMLLEGRAQGRLQHPHIVAVTDVIRLEDGCVGLVMEFVDGAALDRWLRVRGAMGIEEATTLFGQVLAAVGTAHEAGIHHGDLRPGAILLSQDGLIAKVADFGIGQLPYQLRAIRMPAQDQLWLSPEQRDTPGSASVAGDIFSLGCILFEMLTGSSASDPETGRIRDIRAVLPGCPERIADALSRALDEAPEQRFISCAAMAEALFPAGTVLGAPVVPLAPRGATLIPDEDFLSTALPQIEDLPSETTSLMEITVASKRPPPVFPEVTQPRVSPRTLPGDGSHPGTWPGTHPGALPPQRTAAGIVGLIGLLVVAGLGGWWLGASRGPAEVAVVAEPAEDIAPLERVASGALQMAPIEPAEAEVSAVEDAEVEVPEHGAASSVSRQEQRPQPVESRSALAVAPEEDAPAPEPAEDAPAEAEPEAEPVAEVPAEVVEDAASVEAAVASAVPVAEVVEAAEAEPEDAPPVIDLLGSWSGRYQGLPFTLQITRQEGESIAGSFRVQLGSTQRRFAVSGTLTGGRFSLTDGGQVRITGTVSGGTMSGGVIRIGRKEEAGWSATR